MERTINNIATVAAKRFLEVLLINVILSSFLTMVDILGLIKTQELIFITTTAGVVLSLVINIQIMRNYYYDLVDRLIYYTSNYIAYILFFMVNLGVGAIFNDQVYTWLFSIVKFAMFPQYEWSSSVSALLFDALMIASIHIAPIGMGWLVMDED